MRLLTLLAALAAVTFTACGSSGSSHPPLPTPAPSASGTVLQRTLAITWTGAEHSHPMMQGGTSISRHILDSLSSAEPVAMGAVEPSCGSCSTVGPNGSVGTNADSATVMIQEMTTSGSPVPFTSPQVTTPAIVTSGSQTTTAADVVQVPVSANSASTGSGTITVSADGLTSSIPVQVLPNLSIGAEMNPALDVDTSVGAQFDTSGNLTTLTSSSNADVYAVLGTNSSPSEFVFPYGYEVLGASGIGISEETAAPLSFTSQGTTLLFNDIFNNLTADSFLVFATANGHYVYWCLTDGGGYGAVPNYPVGIAEYGSYKFF